MTNTKRALTALLVLLAGLTVLTACGDDSEADAPLLVGSGSSSTMRAAAAVYAVGLSRAGTPATTAGAPVGTDTALMAAISTGGVDLFPAFTGDLLTQLSTRPEALGGEELLTEVARALPQGVAIGDPTGVSDRPQLLLSAGLRDRYDVPTLADCGRLPAGLPLVVLDGQDAAVLAAFAVCRPGAVERVPDARAVIARVTGGEALGVLPALATASAGELGDLRILASDGAPRAQDLVPVYRSAALDKSALKQLSRIAGELTTDVLAELGARVERGEDPGAVAAAWLATGAVS
ncbi:ABC transporter substrate-binding protein [Gordonia alkaliphila]|uniref:glycine betaine ABC transporter substrate-binding protein n=1 Tax=Gordonia alkaliphila TaxID=1053547 RepID=UPI001FF1CDB3|nr:glycine betaine ABC transporter substrate-binding protein [Gordonia alkaliphila]MCK0440103.1 ABC transporter substrate-binding protein [Gordonia alkaliphila]